MKQACTSPASLTHTHTYRYVALINLICGRRITFSPSDNVPVTLSFSPHLRPVYVLGCHLVRLEEEAAH